MEKSLMADSAIRAHLGFLVELARPASDDDTDLLGGRYVDSYAKPLGDVILEARSPTRRFLLIVSDSVVPMHVEAALEHDDRTESRARRAVLRYPKGATVPPGVVRNGDAWEGDDSVAYAFVSEDQATLAQQGS